jgi:hypothetical protein
VAWAFSQGCIQLVTHLPHLPFPHGLIWGSSALKSTGSELLPNSFLGEPRCGRLHRGPQWPKDDQVKLLYMATGMTQRWLGASWLIRWAEELDGRRLWEMEVKQMPAAAWRMEGGARLQGT